MSVTVFFTKEPLPADEQQAMKHFDGLIKKYRQHQGDSKPEVFVKFLNEITKDYPCITKLPHDQVDKGVWADGPLENNIGDEVLALGISKMDPDFLDILTLRANRLGLTAYVYQMEMLFRPFS